MPVPGELEHPAVRDLAWAVFSHDLILAHTIDPDADTLRACMLCELTPARRAWLAALDREPQPLIDYIGARAGQRLGLYFEALWHFFLQADPTVELLAHNLPVRDAGRTIGELDCLYRCRDSDEIVHLELAVKFYLYTGPDSAGTGDDRADWLGPGRRDRLDRKLSHLARHQTRLTRHPVAERLLRSRGLMPARIEAAVKGRLFRRPDQSNQPPTGFNPSRVLLEWDFPGSLRAMMRRREAHRYAILSKRQWLSTLAPASLSDGPDGDGRSPPVYDSGELGEALEQRFSAGSGPLLIAALDAGNHETDRFFIAPPGWSA